MKSLVYGCGHILKFTLQKFDVDYSGLDFTDSDPKIWDSEFVGGKKIIPNTFVDCNDYDFCILGSKVFGEEIYEEAINLGFENKQIIPFDYINSIWERWKKNYFYAAWEKTIADEHITVVSNWQMKGKDAVCILGVNDLLLYDITIKAFELYSIPRCIEIWDESNNIIIGSFEARQSIKYRNNYGETILKIVVKDAVVGIPWCSLHYEKSNIRKEIDGCKLGKQFVNIYNNLQKFPAYDEDYTALVKLNGYKGTILDVGANYGQSMYAFYNMTKCDIVSFEVVPDLYEVLVMMKKIIDVDGRIQIVNSGISDVEEDLIWYEPADPIMSGSFDADFIKGRKLGVDIKEKIMKCQPLDQLISDYDDIWFIKMDVEGMEYEALKGAKKIISHNHPLILIEQNEKVKDIEMLLKNEYDLWYYDVYADKFKEERLSRLNCWLIPKEKFRSDIVNEFLMGRM